MKSFNYDMTFYNSEILNTEIPFFKKNGWKIFEYSVGISKKSDIINFAKNNFPLDPFIEGDCGWQALSDSIGGGFEIFRGNGVLILIRLNIETGSEVSQEAEEFIDILFDVKNYQLLEKMRIFCCYF